MSVRTTDRQIIQTGKATFLQTQLSTAEGGAATVTGSPEGWEVCFWGGGGMHLILREEQFTNSNV